MSEPRAFVKNAADEKQVRSGREKERLRRIQERSDIRALLDLPAGQRFFWRLLTHCAVFQTPYHESERMTTLNIGRGDVGRFVLDEIQQARPGALLKLMQDHYEVSTDDDDDVDRSSND